MALVHDIVTFKTGGTVYIQGSIFIYHDPDDPTVTPYAELTSWYIYASTLSALSSQPSALTIRLGTASFNLSGKSWSTVSGAGSTYSRRLILGSPYPSISLPDLTEGDNKFCTVSLYQSGFGTIQATGYAYMAKRVTFTPPSTVKLNDVNFFSCPSFTLPDNYSLSGYGYGYLRPSGKSCKLYIDATTSFETNNIRGRTISGFYWYPPASLAQSGDFSGGVGEYYLSASCYSISTWRQGTYQSGGVSSTIIAFDLPSGAIYYNETPPAAAAPLVTLTATEVSGAGLYAQYGKYIKGKSQVRYTAAVTYRYGAVQTYYELVVGYNYTTALTYTFWPETAGTATAHAEDDHGAETEVSVNYDVYDYWAPTLTAAIHRCRQDGTRDDSGSYCLIEWAINVAPLGNQNSKSLTITHPAGTSTPTLSSYTASGSLIVAADPEHSYDITFSLTDDFTTVTSTMKLSTAGVIMDIYRGGHGIAFGKVAENDYTLEVTSEWDVLLNTSNAKQINLVDALEALATAAGINIYVQQQNNS